MTGGIGSGKSEALRAFARRGASVLSSDDVVHRLYGDPQVVDAVRQRFGDGVVDAAGSVDRAALADVAFGDPEALAFLEALLHPRIGDARRAWIAAERAAAAPPPLLVCEVPLLFEAGLEDQFDAVLVVTASEAVRRRRVEERGQRFDNRSARQVPEQDKVAGADMWYLNDGSVDQLDAWVGTVFGRYARGAG